MQVANIVSGNDMMTLDDYRKISDRVTSANQRTQAFILRRARQIARLAGLDPAAPYHSAHNATVGTPWREVNLSLARKVLFLERKGWDVARIAGRILDRAYMLVTHSTED